MRGKLHTRLCLSHSHVSGIGKELQEVGETAKRARERAVGDVHVSHEGVWKTEQPSEVQRSKTPLKTNRFSCSLAAQSCFRLRFRVPVPGAAANALNVPLERVLENWADLTVI